MQRGDEAGQAGQDEGFASVHDASTAPAGAQRLASDKAEHHADRLWDAGQARFQRGPAQADLGEQSEDDGQAHKGTDEREAGADPRNERALAKEARGDQGRSPRAGALPLACHKEGKARKSCPISA